MGRFKSFSHKAFRKREGIGVCFPVGTAETMDLPFSSVLPPDFSNLADDIPQLRQYHTSRSEDAEEIFIENSKSVREETPVNTYYQSLASELMSELYPQIDPPSWALKGLAPLDVISVIINVDCTKNPGFPMNSKYYTKGAVLEKHFSDLYFAICARLLCLQYVAPYCLTLSEFFDTFCCDIYGVSVKNEVLKASKKGRNIISVGYLSQCVERLLYDVHSAWYKDTRFEYNSAIGIGFDVETSNILNIRFPGGVFKQDVPTWDHTVTADELLRRAYRVSRQYRVPPGNILRVWLIQHERANVDKFYALPRGRVYVSKFPGQQATGRDQTADSNTDIRNERAYAAAIYANMNIVEQMFTTNPLSAGDDNLDDKNESLSQAYEAMGLPLREAEYTEIVDFCSHHWPVGQAPVGQRIYKGAFKLLLEFDTEEEAGVSFIEEYLNHPEFPALFDLISAHRPEMNTIKNMHSQLINKLNVDQGLLVIPMRRSSRKSSEVLPGPVSPTLPALEAPSAPPVDFLITGRFQCARAKKKTKGKLHAAMVPANTQPKGFTASSTPKAPGSIKKKKGPKPKTGGRRGRVPDAFVHQICGLTNPFCDEALNSRWPDNTYQKSLVGSSIHNPQSFNTDAEGEAAFIFTADPLNTYFFGSVASGTVTWTTGGGGNLPNFTAADISRFRIVSCGVKLNSTLNKLSVQGLVSIRKFSTLAGSATTSLLSVLADDTLDIPLARLCDEDIYITLKPIGDIARVYKNWPSSAANFSTFANPSMFDWVQIGVTGAPVSTTVIRAEYFIHMEYIPQPNKSISQYAVAPPTSDMNVRETANTVSTTIGNFISGVDNVVENLYRSKTLRAAASVYSYYYGGPAAAAGANMLMNH